MRKTFRHKIFTMKLLAGKVEHENYFFAGVKSSSKCHKKWSKGTASCSIFSSCSKPTSLVTYPSMDFIAIWLNKRVPRSSNLDLSTNEIIEKNNSQISHSGCFPLNWIKPTPRCLSLLMDLIDFASKLWNSRVKHWSFEITDSDMESPMRPKSSPGESIWEASRKRRKGRLSGL